MARASGFSSMIALIFGPVLSVSAIWSRYICVIDLAVKSPVFILFCRIAMVVSESSKSSADVDLPGFAQLVNGKKVADIPATEPSLIKFLLFIMAVQILSFRVSLQVILFFFRIFLTILEIVKNKRNGEDTMAATVVAMNKITAIMDFKTTSKNLLINLLSGADLLRGIQPGMKND